MSGNWSFVALVIIALLAYVNTGCQSLKSQQALPPLTMSSDLQYYPEGPEDQLTDQINAIEQYKLEQAGLAEGIDIEPPAPQPGN